MSEEQKVVYVERPGNGMAVAALVCGIVGAVLGVIPILFVAAWGLGAVAVALGIVGRRRAKRVAGAGRGGMALAGTLLGVLALVLGGVGVAIVDDAFDDLTGADEPEQISRAEPAPAVATEPALDPEADGDGDGIPGEADDQPGAVPPADDELDDAPGTGADEFPEDTEDGPQQRYVNIDEAAVDDDVTFKVTSLSAVSSIPGTEFSEGPLTARRGAKLIRADLTYKNNTQTPLDLMCGGASGVVLLDDEDRNYDPVEDLLELQGNEEVCGEEVQPGFKTNVVLAFQVPKGRKVAGLVLWNTEAEDDYDGDQSQVVVLADG